MFALAKRTRSAMPLAAAFSFAISTKAGSISSPVMPMSFSRAARQRLAVPAPAPNSNAVAHAGTAAANITASNPARNPFSGCRAITRPPKNLSALTGPPPQCMQSMLAGEVSVAHRPPAAVVCEGRRGNSNSSRHIFRDSRPQEFLRAVEILIGHHQPARHHRHAAVHDAGMGIEDQRLDARFLQ